MRKPLLPLLAAVLILSCANAQAQSRKTLEVYFIDVRADSRRCWSPPRGNRC